MKKFIRNIALTAASALAMVGCVGEPAEVVDGITLNRCLAPTNLTAEIVASVGTDVELTWDAMQGTDYYTVEVFESTATGIDEETGEEVALAPNYDSAEPFKTETNITEIPHIVSGLEVDKSYFVRVKGHAEGVNDSNWTYLEEAFATSAVRSSFKLTVTDRTKESITIAWSEGEDANDLTTLRATPVSDSSKKGVDLPLTAEMISARTATVSGLEPCTDYKLSLIYGKACNRGSVTAFTRPTDEGFNTVNTVAAIMSAITGNTGDVKLKLEYNNGVAYDLPSTAAIGCNLWLVGETTTDGKKPIVTGLDIQPTGAVTTIHLEDLVLDGAVYAVEGAETKGHILTAKAAMEAFELINCEVFGYTKGLYYNNVAGADCGSILIDGCYVHDVNATGSVGGDFIDIRNGVHPSIVVKNSTFYAAARTFLRVSDSADSGLIEVKNCTFNFVTTTKTSSNNAGIFGVRTKTTPESILCTKNVFMNEYSDGEAPGAEFVRLVRNSSDTNAPVCSGNYYYNVGAGWFVSAALTIDGAAFDEAAAMAEGGVLLEVDPCQSSGAGKLYLNNTSDIAAKQAGDPRWWNAAIPEPPVRATELEVVAEPYIWDFTDKKIYDGEVLNTTTIIGNARIYASAEAPSEILLGEGVYFAAAGMVDAAGEPTHGAVGILTNGYGAVVVTAEGANGVEGVQVLAGGDRYTLLADGEPHKVLLGDLSGDNNIYIIGAGGVTIKQIEWTQDLTADATATALKAPAVAFDNRKVDEGTEMAVTASWAAVENADHYEVTWRGVMTEQTETSFTIDAATVAALGVGEYELSVVAVPVATSSKWLRSEAGVANLQINKVVVGGEVTLRWDHAAFDDIWVNGCASNTGNIDATFVTTQMTAGGNLTIDADGFTYDGLQFVLGGGKFKFGQNNNASGEKTTRVQFGGTGNTGKAVMIFEAPAAGTLKLEAISSGDTSRPLKVVVDDAEVASLDTPDKTGTPQIFEVDCNTAVAGSKIYIYSGNSGINLFSIEYTYVEAAPKANYNWNFSDEIWETEVFSWLAPLGSDGSKDMDITVDGLRIVAGGKNVRGYLDENVGNYIQPNGSGSTTVRCFSFTAPGDGVVRVKVSGTSGSADMSRNVCLQVGDDASTLQQIAGGYASSEPTVIEFEIAADNQTVYIYPSGGLRFFQFEYQQN